MQAKSRRSGHVGRNMNRFQKVALFALVPATLVGSLSLVAARSPEAGQHEHTEVSEAPKLSDYGEPAIISLGGRSAMVIDVKDGQVLIVDEPSTMAMVAARQHVQDERMFEAFPVAEFSEAWNSCNEMKDRLDLHHADGVNSMVSFNAGPEEQAHNRHWHTAPLLTATEAPQRTSGGSEGIFRTMLDNARLKDGKLTFDIRNHRVTPGKYDNVDVMMECITCSDCRPPCEPDKICY